ncbi:Aldehyde, CO or xanthine dehydrogenase, Mo-binding subunit [Cupriavidus necator]|uniref:4-Hydroxybenzoyl-CoA reductase,molybdopterin-binding subunit A n=1 Tax=Cupriavidus necator (strain ATCC 17699 / DSM 428 / KCTC 22496 / NCIMB 10442 / H16 / Stanier 337) TaxID=381666 RepID=Q0K384_CUPNH|nr:xanthine dehydrogenase family protein molybdopterin-binding subunit [Cupriavidus necator]QCC03439.1 xanthine dehydrogenase family protein molybdopterin-binding subunit [Cupriavidus necator H16]QQB80495.1 xanthine dehydrogenase family protein molybdopterin-binding subunit [Cupriavidus necator]WKA44777.1 xanthine dehydrogenase family protein molybdopterin-binding subunit [Cupriavidus necator]CAJ95540.1 4-Hydroxybenzoyl-CoA reductase,molybdopterin-binding subunit A [Cupriavidus necator H16]
MSKAIVGSSTPQVTAREKVMGRAQYAGDIKLPGMLHAKVLRSPHPHARIVRIDTSAAKALPGVKLVVTGHDVPARNWGPHRKEQRILACGVVRHVGEEVAAVVAVSEEIARDALDLVRIEYEALPALLTPEAALADGAPEIHAGTRNIGHEMHIVRGDVDAAFEACAAVYEATYDMHSQYPGYLEPMASVAAQDGNGRLTLWASTQSVFLARARLAEALDRPVSTIRVVQATTGGGFGAKIVEENNSLICAFLASRLERPVRLVNNRLEDFQGARASVPMKVWLRMGLSADGVILAKDVRIAAECGAYSGLAGDVMHVTAMRSDNMHRVQNVRSHAVMAYTNNPPRGAFRGFGGQQMQFPLNCHLTVLAGMLGMDPVEVHKRNAIGAGETSVHGWKISSTGMAECLEMTRKAIGWDEKRAAPRGTGTRRRGVGIAAAMHVSGNRTLGNWDGSTILLKINEDGRAMLQTSECDMGQGANTMLSQICAQELGIPLSHVTVMAPDTDTAPFCLGSLASRVTIIAGNALLRAAREARQKLLALAAEKLGVDAEQLAIADGRIAAPGQPDKSATLAEIARLHIFRHGGEGIHVRATYDAPTVMHDADYYGNVAPAHSFAAQAVEVEVDTSTGQVTVIDSFVADDCGKAINPLAVHGQTHGATVQAIGWTLYENLQYEDGRLMNGNFADYTMPTADAVPMLRTDVVESNDPNGPYGAKGASETAILPGAAAIANAVFDAVGVRIQSLPITPEKVLAGLRELKQKEAVHA